MRSNAEGGKYQGIELVSARIGVQRLALLGDLELDADGPIANYFDPNGADRTLILPPIEKGFFFIFHFVGLSAHTIRIEDFSGNMVVELQTGMSAILTSSEEEWTATRAWADLEEFHGAGPGHRRGLVPDPGPIAQALRFLREDGVWAEAMDDGNVDAFKFITDGSNTATANGGDTFRIRSADNSLQITVSNNDATYGDSVDIQVVEANIDHDALNNFVADEHVAHSSVTIGGEEGVQGGGNITASRLLKLAFGGLSAANPELGDTAAFLDATDSVHKKTTFADINAILVHNNLAGYEADRHIDHSTISVTAGTGLSGGGVITTSVTLNLDLGTIPTGTPSGDDLILFDDITFGVFKTDILGLNAILDHDTLAGFEANEHINHSLVEIQAGTGLTGGGTIAATRSLSLSASVQASLALADSALQPSAIGVSIQPYDADLATWAGVTSSANGRSLVSAADYAAMKTLLSLNNVNNTADSAKPVSTAQAAADLAAKSVSSIGYKTGSYTLVAGDAGNTIVFDSASAMNLTLPAGVLPAGSFVNIVQWTGVGVVTAIAGAGASRVAKGSAFRSNGPYSGFQVWTHDGTQWLIIGDTQV